MITGRLVWGGSVLWSVALVTSLIAGDGSQTTSRADAAKMKNPVASSARIDRGRPGGCSRRTAGSATARRQGQRPDGAQGRIRRTSPTPMGSRLDRRRDLPGHPRRRRPEVQDEGLQGQDDRHRHLERRQLPPQPWRCQVIAAGMVRRSWSCWPCAAAAWPRPALLSPDMPAPRSAVTLGYAVRVHAGAPHRRRSHSDLLSASGRSASSRFRFRHKTAHRERTHVHRTATRASRKGRSPASRA